MEKDGKEIVWYIYYNRETRKQMASKCPHCGARDIFVDVNPANTYEFKASCCGATGWVSNGNVINGQGMRIIDEKIKEEPGRVIMTGLVVTSTVIGRKFVEVEESYNGRSFRCRKPVQRDKSCIAMKSLSVTFIFDFKKRTTFLLTRNKKTQKATITQLSTSTYKMPEEALCLYNKFSSRLRKTEAFKNCMAINHSSGVVDYIGHVKFGDFYECFSYYEYSSFKKILKINRDPEKYAKKLTSSQKGLLHKCPSKLSTILLMLELKRFFKNVDYVRDLAETIFSKGNKTRKTGSEIEAGSKIAEPYLSLMNKYEKALKSLIRFKTEGFVARYIKKIISNAGQEEQTATTISMLTDTLRSLNGIIDMDGNLSEIDFAGSMNELHDRFSKIYTALSLVSLPIEYSEDELSLEDKTEDKRFKFLLPRETHEIHKIGEEARNCVGGYSMDAKTKKLFIVGVFDSVDEKYRGCIELHKKRGVGFVLIQMKGPVNKPPVGKLKKPLIEAFLDWAKEKNVIVKDCGDYKELKRLKSEKETEEE